MAYHSKYTGAEVDALLGKVESGEVGGKVTVDSALSTESENPVMNKVITVELNNKADKNETDTKLAELSEEVSIITTLVNQSYDAKGTATLVSGLNLRKGLKYTMTFEVNDVTENTIYVYLKDQSGVSLKISTIAIGKNKTTIQYSPTEDMQGCSIESYCGVAKTIMVTCRVIDTFKLASTILSENYLPISITRDNMGMVSQASVQYADSTRGTLEITRDDMGNPTSITATYNDNSIIITLSRDNNGNVLSLNIN